MNQVLKHSKQRDALLALLRSVTSHPSAEWLWSELKKDFPQMSLATVYRNLGVLCECGEAIRLDIGDGTVRYDAQTRAHNHFFCTSCHRLSDIGEDETDVSELGFAHNAFETVGEVSRIDHNNF